MFCFQIFMAWTFIVVGGEQRPLAARKVDGRAGEQAAAPVFLLSPNFSPITISLRADRILPGWRNNKLPPGHKMVQLPGNTDHSVPSRDWGRGRFCSQLRPSRFIFPSLSPIFGT